MINVKCVYMYVSIRTKPSEQLVTKRVLTIMYSQKNLRGD